MNEPVNNQELNKVIDERVKKLITFSKRKIGDTPTDDKMFTPRGYVTMNGASTARPIGSVTGQFFFDTTINKPIWRKANGAWVDATSSVV